MESILFMNYYWKYIEAGITQYSCGHTKLLYCIMAMTPSQTCCSVIRVIIVIPAFALIIAFSSFDVKILKIPWCSDCFYSEHRVACKNIMTSLVLKSIFKPFHVLFWNIDSKYLCCLFAQRKCRIGIMILLEFFIIV